MTLSSAKNSFASAHDVLVDLFTILKNSFKGEPLIASHLNRE